MELAINKQECQKGEINMLQPLEDYVALILEKEEKQRRQASS